MNKQDLFKRDVNALLTRETFDLLIDPNRPKEINISIDRIEAKVLEYLDSHFNISNIRIDPSESILYPRIKAIVRIVLTMEQTTVLPPALKKMIENLSSELAKEYSSFFSED